MTEKEIVTAGEGQDAAVLAADLIRLADHPHDVTWSPRLGGFIVPQEVAVRYAVASIGAATGDHADESETDGGSSPKKPRKAAASTRKSSAGGVRRGGKSGRRAGDVKGGGGDA